MLLATRAIYTRLPAGMPHTPAAARCRVCQQPPWGAAHHQQPTIQQANMRSAFALRCVLACSGCSPQHRMRKLSTQRARLSLWGEAPRAAHARSAAASRGGSARASQGASSWPPSSALARQSRTAPSAAGAAGAYSSAPTASTAARRGPTAPAPW